MPYTTEWEELDKGCPHCGSGGIRYRMWDSSDEAHTDTKYNCQTCDAVWWVEGGDC